MNHSCDPNSLNVYSEDDTYYCKCLKVIEAGSEITCDYSEIDPLNDLEKFECQCQSVNCRGMI